jgi:hypothetical protein
MATVKRKKTLQQTVDMTKQPYQSGIRNSMVDPMLGNVATTMPAQVGSLSGQITTPAQVGGLSDMGMKNQMESIEMGKESGVATQPMMPSKPAKPSKKVKIKSKKQQDPPGTFRNADGNLVVGDMKKFTEWQNKK